MLPDAGFSLVTAAGASECYLEWDRGTETQARLTWKVIGYQRAESGLCSEAGERSVLFVIPGERRLATLRRAHSKVAAKRRQAYDVTTRWCLLATTSQRLKAHGSLGAICERLDDGRAARVALPELPPRRDLQPVALSETLGRRWRKDDPAFWRRLSPQGNQGLSSAEDPEPLAVLHEAERKPDLRVSGIDGSMDDLDNDLEEKPWV